MKKIYLTLLFCWLFSQFISAQIINGQDTLYGNEWIKFDQSYFKIMVAEDGIYKIDHQQLADAGIPVSQIPGNQYQLFHNGEEVPIYTTTNNVFSAADHLEFYGQKNRSELDRYLFQNPDEEMMNPLYSLFTDTSAYFLTWTDVGTPKRYEIVGNDLTNLPAKEAYYMEELVMELHTTWGQEGYNYSFASTFNNAEGFSGPYKNIQEFIVKPTSPYVNGEQAMLEIRYSANAKPHQQQISLNGAIWKVDEFNNIDLRTIKDGISNTLLTGDIKVHFQGLASNSDQQRVSNIILNYPREFNASSSSFFNFSLTPSTAKKYVEITGFNGAAGPTFLYDITNQTKIEAIYENGIIKLAIPPDGEKRDFILVNQNAIKNPVNIQPIEFIDYKNTEADYLILSNNKLFDDGQGINRVQEYADYRSSMAGGGYKTLIIDVQQLYDQFGWGINRHCLPIRNFGLYVKKNWQEPAKYLFIIGKGRNYESVRTASQLNSAGNASFYVPTFGSPGSDVLLMAENEGMAPYLAVGRLPVENPEEIDVYLRKVKEHQELMNAPSTIADRAWMKKVMHLGGGGTAAEQAGIRNNLENMGNVLTNSQYGAEVHGFYKNNTDPVQISTNEAIFNLINTGVSIITFFGHSAVNTFDFNIDNPDNYKNKGRYPIMFSLGCYIGGIHTSTKGVSERFVFHDEGAAIAFIASTGAGYISSLNTYTRNAYSLMGNSQYGQSIGDVLKANNEYLESINFGDQYLVHQFTLNGDPAIKTSIFEGPDYTIDYTSVKLMPGIVNVTADSFQLEFDLLNIGKSSLENDTIEYLIKQKLPNNQEIILINGKTLVPINRKKIKTNLPTLGDESVGLNQLYITLDPDDKIEEKPDLGGEANNELKSQTTGELGYTFYIQNNGAKAIYPYEFAIVGDQDLTLNASTYDPLVSTQKYIFQLDTIETFDSPFLMQYELEQSGGVLKWKPGIALQEEEVYYWRVSPDSVSTVAGYNWSENSFVYLEGKEGWNQSDFGQYARNELDSMQADHEERELAFLNRFHDVRLINKASTSAQYFGNSGNWSPGFFMWNISSLKSGVHIATFSPRSINYWFNEPPGQYGSVNNHSWAEPHFPFPTETANQRENLIEFLENIIPNDYYVIFYTGQKTSSESYFPDEWAADSIAIGKNLYSLLEGEGAMKVRLLDSIGSVPYILIYQKGKGMLMEEIAQTVNDEIKVEYSFPEVNKSGNLSTLLIGPSKKWKKLEWLLDDATVINSVDSIILSLVGKIGQNNSLYDSVLFENILFDELDLSIINAQSFPFLELKYEAYDEIDRSPGQVKFWRVEYENIPEFAINPSASYTLYNDTLQQGDHISLFYQIENLSQSNGDSLLVSYKITDTANKEVAKSNRLKALESKETIIDHFQLSTADLSGLQNIEVYINPNYDQPELTNINNYLIDKFYVAKDKRNPLLDITFDGEHVINGGLVSPTPLISIVLSDENLYLPIDDTTQINVFIKRPGQEVPERISYADPSVTFYPAQENKNEAKVEYRGDFRDAGEGGDGYATYELLVQATDVTGNQSGEHDFKLLFTVNNNSALSNFVNYPNPFSTSTRFLYTLTGRELPADYKLQIMTVSGKIIREVDELELGQLKLGTHITDFAWNGTDQYGDQLANGVYLYRFIINEETGFENKKLENGKVDKYFKAGIGKMVLIR